MRGLELSLLSNRIEEIAETIAPIIQELQLSGRASLGALLATIQLPLADGGVDSRNELWLMIQAAMLIGGILLVSFLVTVGQDSETEKDTLKVVADGDGIVDPQEDSEDQETALAEEEPDTEENAVVEADCAAEAEGEVAEETTQSQ